MEKVLDDFIEEYIEGSSIREVNYDNTTKKWTIKYNYDVPDDEFESAKDMIDFIEMDRFDD